MLDDVQAMLREVGNALIVKRENFLGSGRWEKTQFKSEADLMAEEIISSSLHKITPNMPIMTEEDLGSHKLNRDARYWLVDPLDGTASYCEGFNGFVTQIALMVYNIPVLSAVYAPVSDSMYTAELNSGARLNGEPLKIKSNISEICLIDNYPKPRGIAQLINRSSPDSKYIELGSIGLKICKVADGTANLFVKDVIVRDWDLAPGHLILSEAGGIFRDLNCNGIKYSGEVEQQNGIIAAASEALVYKVKKILDREL